MCEPAMLAKTGLTVADHQRLTIERYDALVPLVGDVYLMPVLQGYRPDEYVSHIEQYGARLKPGMWGVYCRSHRTARTQRIQRGRETDREGWNLYMRIYKRFKRRAASV